MVRKALTGTRYLSFGDTAALPRRRHAPRMRGWQYAAAPRTVEIQLSNSPPRYDRSQPRPRDLAACFARGLILDVPPSSTEGAGNAGCALHPWPPVQQKSTGVSNQGYTASTGIPCTMVLRLIRDLPGDHAWLPPSPVVVSTALAPASERQDHAISPSARASFVAQKIAPAATASIASRFQRP
jgi:hypothetical protein